MPSLHVRLGTGAAVGARSRNVRMQHLRTFSSRLLPEASPVSDVVEASRTFLSIACVAAVSLYGVLRLYMRAGPYKRLARLILAMVRGELTISARVRKVTLMAAVGRRGTSRLLLLFMLLFRLARWVQRT